MNLEAKDHVVENLSRIERTSNINLILLVLSIILVGFATYVYVLYKRMEGDEPVVTTLFGLMYLGLILIIISRILIKKTNPNQNLSKIKRMIINSNQSLSKIERMLVNRLYIGIIGFLLVLGLFIGIVIFFIPYLSVW